MTTDDTTRAKRLLGFALAACDPAAYARLVPPAARQEIEADPAYDVLRYTSPDTAMAQRAALDLMANGVAGVAGVGPLFAAHVFLDGWASLTGDPDLRAERQLVNTWLRSRGVDAEVAPPSSFN
jgi:hypothetical protein